ncbi:MAG TPA: hypothetical protein VNK82_07330 [Terriglobales bacterium]|nr:hypothetical protein [Terriglobales bacterium]
MRRLFAAVLFAVSISSALAQDTGTEPDSAATATEPTKVTEPARDPAALAALEAAVAATGGRIALSQVRDCVAVGRMQAADGSGLGSGSFVWKDAGREFRYENPRPDGPQVVVSGRGRPALAHGGRTERLRGQTTLNHVAPHLAGVALYNRLADTRYSLRVLGPGTVNGRPAVVVRTYLASAEPVLAEATQQDWFLDAGMGLPLRVEIQVPSPDGTGWQVAAMELSDFRVVSGIVVPFQIVTWFGEQPQALMVLDTFSFNTGLSPTEFEAPTGGGQ